MNEFLSEFIRQGFASLVHPPPGSIPIRADSGHLLEFALADSFSSPFGRGHDRAAPSSATGVYQGAQRFHVVGRYSQLNRIILVHEVSGIHSTTGLGLPLSAGFVHVFCSDSSCIQ